MAFVAKYIAHPRYSALLISISNAIFGAWVPTRPLLTTTARAGSVSLVPVVGVADMYAPLLGQSFAIDQLFLRLQARVRQEVKLEKQLLQLQGALDLIMAAAAGSDATK